MDRQQIDNLLAKTDIVTLAESAGAKLYRQGKDYRGACPIHGGKNENAFVIFTGDDGKQAWNCFTECGGGDALSFVMKWKGIRFPDAVKFLGGEPCTPEQEAQIAIARAERAAQMAEQAAREAREAVEALKSTEIWMKYHEQLTEDSRLLWTERGIPETFQDIWNLGYCPSKHYMTKAGELITASMTIPLYTYGWEVINVKHRLLNPINPNDKYRPEKSGLSMPAYICDPDMTKDKAENILIVEGEIKSMVTYITLDNPKWQVIGLPGKDAKKVKGDLVADFAGRNCIVCLDPDGKEQAKSLAKVLGGKMFTLPAKIDDLITQNGMTKSDLQGLIKQAARII